MQTTVQKLTTECISDVQNYLKIQFSGGKNGRYIFRRAGKNIQMRNPVYKKVTPFSTEIPSSTYGLTSEVMKKNGQIDCSEFYGFTTTHAMRKEPFCTLDTPIMFKSSTYKQPNVGLRIDGDIKHEVTTPLEGDLLCIWLKNETCESHKRYKSIEADAWFIVSEQFLRAHTLIMYDWHDSFDSLIPKNTPIEKREEALRRKLFIGNNLMTNGWLKHKLSLEQSGMSPMETKESLEKYWHLRSEPASRNYVDVYAALVLMARYGEAPTAFNVPNNNNDGPKRTQWSLPPNFLAKFQLETVPIPQSQMNIQITLQVEVPKAIVAQKPRAVDILFSIDWY